MDEIVKEAEELRDRLRRAVSEYDEAKRSYVGVLRLGRSLESGQDLETQPVDSEEIKRRKRIHDDKLAQRLATENDYWAFVQRHREHLSDRAFEP